MLDAGTDTSTGISKLKTCVNDPAPLIPAVTITDLLPCPLLDDAFRHVRLLELAHLDASHAVHPTDADMLTEVIPKLSAVNVTDAVSTPEPPLRPATVLISPSSYDTVSLMVAICSTAVTTIAPDPPAPLAMLHTMPESDVQIVEAHVL